MCRSAWPTPSSRSGPRIVPSGSELGALALDLLLAVLVTSALRHRIGYGSWRFVHWLAYLCWPIAMLHGLGTGSDASLGPVLAVDALCAVAVLAAVAWRLATGRTLGTAHDGRGSWRWSWWWPSALRRPGAAASRLVPPAGTSSALLAEIAAKATGHPVVPAPRPLWSTSTPAPRATSGQVPGAVLLSPAPDDVTLGAGVASRCSHLATRRHLSVVTEGRRHRQWRVLPRTVDSGRPGTVASLTGPGAAPRRRRPARSS